MSKRYSLPRRIHEASIDHFTPRLYAAARRMERDVRTKKLTPIEKKLLKLGDSLPVGGYQIKGQNPNPIHLHLGGANNEAVTKHYFWLTPHPQDPNKAISGERQDTIHLNAGYAGRQGVPMRGNLSRQGVRVVSPRDTTQLLAHELMHATDPAREFSYEKQKGRLGKNYTAAYNQDASQKEIPSYNISPAETHARAGEVMFGMHRGKRVIDANSSRELLRLRGKMNVRSFAPEPGTKEYADARSRFNTHETLRAYRRYQTEPGVNPKRAKQAYRKLAKESFKAHERVYGAFTRKSYSPRDGGMAVPMGHLPEATIDYVIFKNGKNVIDQRVREVIMEEVFRRSAAKIDDKLRNPLLRHRVAGIGDHHVRYTVMPSLKGYFAFVKGKREGPMGQLAQSLAVARNARQVIARKKKGSFLP